MGYGEDRAEAAEGAPSAQDPRPFVMGKAASAIEHYLGDAAYVSATGVAEYDRIKQDRDNVRAIRDARKPCVRCTFCGRCKRAERRRPVHEHLLDSL